MRGSHSVFLCKPHKYRVAGRFSDQLLAKSAARGGNELMNIGPLGNGQIDQADVNILRGIGKWWAINGESIRGTTRTPLAVQAWGESTRKGNRLYLHVFQWPAGGKLVIGGLKTDVANAFLQAEPGKALKVTRAGIDQVVAIPEAAPDMVDSVLVVDCASEPVADSVRLLSNAVASDRLHVFDGKRVGGLAFGPGKKTDDLLLNWNTKEKAIAWPVRVNEKGTFSVSANYSAPKGLKGNQVVNGDAGKEISLAHKGSGGVYEVSIAGKTLTQTVRQGDNLVDDLGAVTLDPGTYEFRVSAKEITGEELMRLRCLTLKPVGDNPGSIVN